MDPKEEFITERFAEVSEKYKEDTDVIESQRKTYESSKEIAMLLEGQGGEELKKWLDGEITVCLMRLLDTREARYLSDLKSLYELRLKLTNSKTIKESIEDWLSKI